MNDILKYTARKVESFLHNKDIAVYIRMFHFRIDIALIQIFIHIQQNILLCSTWLPCLACFLEAKIYIHGNDNKAHPNSGILKGSGI